MEDKHSVLQLDVCRKNKDEGTSF